MNLGIIQHIQSWFQNRKTESSSVCVPRDQHTISRKQISPNALRVLYRLKQYGYAAYLVGGGVRDLLLDRVPKDFDIATDASPEEVRNIFRNCRLIGRRFRLAHVYFDNEIIEVSTFRANLVEPTKVDLPKQVEKVPHPMLLSDNTYGTIEEDAWRRDFTVNALYYNIADFSVIDFTSGMKDLKNKIIRVIGDPAQRFHEDPIRLLRAIRFAAKLNFQIHPHTQALVLKLRPLIFHVPKSRLFDEVLKLFFEGYSYVTYKKLVDAGYMEILFPSTMKLVRSSETTKKLIIYALESSDQRFMNNQSLNPGYLFSVLLWPVLQEMIQKEQNRQSWFIRFSHAAEKTIASQMETLLLPRRMLEMMKSIWILQYSLERRRARRIYGTFHQRYFRAGIDFLELRSKVDFSLTELVVWWRKFQGATEEHQKEMIDHLR